VDTGAPREKVAALVLLGLGVAFHSMFAVGELVGGDIGGVQHVPPALGLAVLLWVAWRRPLVAGIVLLALAVPLGAVYLVLLVVRDLPLIWALFIALPPLVTGLLLVRAGQGERGRPDMSEDMSERDSRLRACACSSPVARFATPAA